MCGFLLFNPINGGGGEPSAFYEKRRKYLSVCVSPVAVAYAMYVSCPSHISLLVVFMWRHSNGM